jgi:hypothetical protein
MIDLLDEIMSLPSLEGYSKRDRYADFHQMFAQDERGRRVLREILGWGGMFQIGVSGNPIDPFRTHVRNGERNMALRLLDAVYIEPPEPPEKQRRVNPKKRASHG